MTDTKPMTGQPQKDLGSSGAVASSGPDSQCPTTVADPLLSKTRFFGLLSGLHIVDERAYNDPDGYDGGVMLCRLDRLYATVRAALSSRKHDPEREARAAGGVGDERDGRKEAAAPALKPEGGGQ